MLTFLFTNFSKVVVCPSMAAQQLVEAKVQDPDLSKLTVRQLREYTDAKATLYACKFVGCKVKRCVELALPVAYYLYAIVEQDPETGWNVWQVNVHQRGRDLALEYVKKLFHSATRNGGVERYYSAYDPTKRFNIDPHKIFC